MKAALRLKPITSILIIYLFCGVLRALEYMLLRTDQTIFGEAFVHKLGGILALILAVQHFGFSWCDIGLAKKSAVKKVFYGLLLGAVSFAAAYGIEIFLLVNNGNAPSLQGYVTGYALSGNRGNQTELLFFTICVLSNIINVVMEEGVFRGLFIKLAERRHTFTGSVLISF